MLGGKERKEIRGRAHALKAAVHVGKEGITDSLLAEIERTAKSAEIVKIKVLPNSFLQMADGERILAEKLPGEVVGRVGRNLIYFQAQPEEPPSAPPSQTPKTRGAHANTAGPSPRKAAPKRQEPGRRS